MLRGSTRREFMALNALEQQGLAEFNLARAQPVRLTHRLSYVGAVSVVLVLALWEIFGRRVNPLFLSYASSIGRAFVQLLGSGEFERQALGSLQVFAIGLSAALVVGIAFGLIMGRY